MPSFAPAVPVTGYAAARLTVLSNCGSVLLVETTHSVATICAEVDDAAGLPFSVLRRSPGLLLIALAAHPGLGGVRRCRRFAPDSPATVMPRRIAALTFMALRVGRSPDTRFRRWSFPRRPRNDPYGIWQVERIGDPGIRDRVLGEIGASSGHDDAGRAITNGFTRRHRTSDAIYSDSLSVLRGVKCRGDLSPRASGSGACEHRIQVVEEWPGGCEEQEKCRMGRVACARACRNLLARAAGQGPLQVGCCRRGMKPCAHLTQSGQSSACTLRTGALVGVTDFALRLSGTDRDASHDSGGSYLLRDGGEDGGSDCSYPRLRR